MHVGQIKTMQALESACMLGPSQTKAMEHMAHIKGAHDEAYAASQGPRTTCLLTEYNGICFECRAMLSQASWQKNDRRTNPPAPGSMSLTRWLTAGSAAALSINAIGPDSGHTQIMPSSTCSKAHSATCHASTLEVHLDKDKKNLCFGRLKLQLCKALTAGMHPEPCSHAASPAQHTGQHGIGAGQEWILDLCGSLLHSVSMTCH